MFLTVVVLTCYPQKMVVEACHVVKTVGGCPFSWKLPDVSRLSLEGRVVLRFLDSYLSDFSHSFS